MMKFKNVFAAALPLLAVAGAVVSCNDYDNGYSEKALVYAQEFETTYGSVDPDQDWNLAMRGSVTVTVAKPSKVTIYALVNGIYSIVGDYADVTATQTLEFDVLEGTTQLIVTDGTQGIHTTVGGSVSFGGGSSAHTRAANYGNNLDDKNGQGTNISVTRGEYITFTKEEAKAYESVLPEINDPECTYEASNLSRNITKNFKYVSNGKFTFYPVYWQTGAANEVGIYYTDEQGRYHEVRVYDIKSGNELLNVYGDNHTEPVPAEDESSTAGYDRGVVSQRAQAITIDIPEGTVFGFYLINTFAGTSHTFYSEAEKNPLYPSRFGEGHANNHGCYTASVTSGNSKYLCFEDWIGGDFDLNDVVFKFAGNVPTTIDEDPDAASWILACEDLGGSFDWDFNDVVFKVTHISGQTTATITPLAAGGTLASYIFFDNPSNTYTEETCLGEIHQLIDANGCVSGEYTPYNVYANSRGKAGKSFNINVDEDWTMAYYSSENFNENEQYKGDNKDYNMGGFKIRVLKAGTTTQDKTLDWYNSAFGDASIVAAPGKGDAPQMICLPATYELGEYTYEWAWSLELETMADGQGNGSYRYFAGWVNDHRTNTDWYKNPNTATTVPEKKWKIQSAAPTKQPSDLCLTQNSIDVVRGSSIDLRNYITTSSSGLITYTSPNEGGIWNKDKNIKNSNMFTTTGDWATTFTITIKQEATDTYEGGEVYITVNLVEGELPFVTDFNGYIVIYYTDSSGNKWDIISKSWITNGTQIKQEGHNLWNGYQQWMLKPSDEEGWYYLYNKEDKFLVHGSGTYTYRGTFQTEEPGDNGKFRFHKDGSQFKIEHKNVGYIGYDAEGEDNGFFLNKTDDNKIATFNYEIAPNQ